MPIPEPTSLFGMYGNREIFQRKLEHGYNTISNGKGNRRSDEKGIASIFVLYHPQHERVFTYIHPKFLWDSEGRTFLGNPLEKDLYPQDLELFQIKYDITLSEPIDFARLLSQWTE